MRVQMVVDDLPRRKKVDGACRPASPLGRVGRVLSLPGQELRQAEAFAITAAIYPSPSGRS